jgi:hypothetical protein
MLTQNDDWDWIAQLSCGGLHVLSFCFGSKCACVRHNTRWIQPPLVMLDTIFEVIAFVWQWSWPTTQQRVSTMIRSRKSCCDRCPIFMAVCRPGDFAAFVTDRRVFSLSLSRSIGLFRYRNIQSPVPYYHLAWYHHLARYHRLVRSC